MMKSNLRAGIVAIIISLVARGTNLQAASLMDGLVNQAVDADQTVAVHAIKLLRDAGPAGLTALITANAPLIGEHRSSDRLARADSQWERLTSALDAVAAQRDAYASGLYWYTDLPVAQAAAKASGKPILALRLLGNLSDEYSCANSRFFRTVLYANTEVSKKMRDDFILYWQSVRPVPVITIDFGDGRILRRTITGNSIHYVLTVDGTVVDGIPGLYGPAAFVRELNNAENAFHSPDLLAQWHTQQAAQIAKEFETDRKTILNPLELTDADWSRIAHLHAKDATVDGSTIALMKQKNPTAYAAGLMAMSKRYVETPLIRAVANLQRSVAEDTVRNEYLLHLKIHQWLADPAQDPLVHNVIALNKRIYTELFLMPDSDPWLGLMPPDTYSALEDQGIIVLGGAHAHVFP